MLPDANFLSPWCQSQSPRAQNRGFCALLGSETLVSGHFEHKIEVFVRFYPPSPIFGRFEHIICIFVLGVAPAAMSQITLGDANTGAMPLQRR